MSNNRLFSLKIQSMKTYNNPNPETWESILKRPAMDFSKIENIVSKILNNVRQNGDTALKEYSKKFDRVDLDTLAVSTAELEEAENLVSKELKTAINIARQNIIKFHASQEQKIEIVETMPGVSCWRKSVAIQKVGLYIPGGTAPLFSTVLMLGIPAKLAGCEEIILSSPPNTEGKIHPAILYTAHLIGIKKIFKLGGAQAIGAMAYGTETVPKAYKIFGPGNQYVTAAKMLVNKEGIPIDMPAGPSEVLVVADKNCEPSFVAADLLSQAEHGEDSQVILVAFEEEMVSEIDIEINKQLNKLPRKSIAEKALKNSVTIIMDSEEEAKNLVNFYAPEHLIIATRSANNFAKGIVNAGSIFLGNYTPESAGDYASGTNHTLPTNGFAKSYSGVSLDSFVKKITYQKLTKEGLRNIGKTIELMAEAEELEAHKNAVSIRLSKI
jgi:histidinol dehydrogenase